MKRSLLATFVVATFVVPLVAQNQSDQKRLAFEVASVKPNKSTSTFMSRGGTPTLYEVTNAPLRLLGLNAYGVMTFELIGAPNWIDNERFEVVAKLTEGTDRQQVPSMLRQLLAERFRLAVHTETRSVPTYDLVVAGSVQPNLVKTGVDCAAVVAAVRSGAKPSIALPRPQRGRAATCGMLEQPGFMSLRGVTIKQVSVMLSQRVNRRVIDRTGLTDAYDIYLHFAPESADGRSSDEPSLFTALQDQLGLKLVSSKNTLDVLVAQTQSDQKLPQFDVASIKENTSITEGGGGTGRLLPGGGLAMKHLPALSYVTMAFHLEPYQLVGAPAWMTMTYYDVQAKPAVAATRDDTFKMLQALLRDRFQLRFHRESKELDGYALVMVRAGQLGPDLHRSSVDCEKAFAASTRCREGFFNTGGKYKAVGTPLYTLVDTIVGQVHGPVVDQTQLTGTFDLDLQWSPDGAGTDTATSIFTALKEQLGLKLERIRVPTEMFVVDHVEKPTPD